MVPTHLQDCIARIQAHSEESSVALTHVENTEQVLAKRSQCASGSSEHALDGLVCSIKACIDVQGWVTHAGSKALQDRPAAVADAPVVAALRAEGALCIAQTNMTEFAYGALGVNEHFGTPCSPLFGSERRVAGGSSSGGAVSVALGFADIALGSDTSGSARIPAAFCGVVGFKPTHARWPLEGFIPLAPSFDTPGILATSVATCKQVFDAIDATLSRSRANANSLLATDPSRPFRVRVPTNVLEYCPPDDPVKRAFVAALDVLRAEGWLIDESPMPSLDGLGRIAADAGMIAAEAYSVHYELLDTAGDRYDPLIRERIEAGKNGPAWRYAAARDALARRAVLYAAELEGYDAVVCPTTPMLPPTLEQLADRETYLAQNKRSFAYTELANRLGVPSISVPINQSGAAGVGLLLTGKSHLDTDLFYVATALDAALSHAHSKKE